MQIKEVMEKYHVSRKSLLIYEEKQLINPHRNESGYREYSQEDMKVIKKILLLRTLDFSFDEIKEILIDHHKEKLDLKKDSFDKDIHLLETKKGYIDYINDVFDDEYSIDEAIEALNETMQLYKNNHFDNMIHFQAGREAWSMMSIVCLIISICSHRIEMIALCLIAYLISSFFFIKEIRKLFLSKPMKKVIGAIVFVGSLISICYFLQQEDTMNNCILCGLSVMTFYWSLSCFSTFNEFYQKYKKQITCLYIILGLGLLICVGLFEIDHIVGYTLAFTGIMLISIGLHANGWFKYIMYFFFG